VHLVGFITKKFVTIHGHMSRCTVTCHDAQSHVTMHGHMFRCTVTCHDAQSHERKIHYKLSSGFLLVVRFFVNFSPFCITQLHKLLMFAKSLFSFSLSITLHLNCEHLQW